VGRETVITINDADFARHVLQTRSDNYVKGRFYDVVFGQFLGRSSLTMNGDEWRQRRRLISPAFNARAIRGCEAVVEKHVEAMLADWDATAGDSGGERNLTEDVSALAMRVAMEAFFSAEMGEETSRIGDLMDKVITDAGSPPFADIMGLPRWAPRRSRRRARAWLAELDEWLYALIDRRLSTRGQGEPEHPDLLDVLVHAKDEETGELLDRQSIRNEVMTLFAAGHETTALSLAWGLDRLAREPEQQARLAAAASEAQAAAGAPLDAARAREVALLPASYDEMLRLYPPAVNIGRQAIGPDRFEDLEIRPTDRVQIVVGHLHRNPRYWRDPGLFDPDRFLPEGRKGRHPFAHIPFGGGPRICVGLALARLEGLLTLARALPRFRLEPVGAPPEPLGKITLRTREPVPIRLVRRA
jgi:cytochrome P450